MCTNPFFLCHKKNGFEISGLCGSHPLPWYQMVSDTFRVLCGCFPGPRSVRKTFRADLPVKNMIFRSHIHWFPHEGPGPGWGWIWEENQWFSAVRGSSAGNRWSNSTETIQKLHFEISGPVSPPRGILGASGGIEVETDLYSLLYTSFTSPLIIVIHDRVTLCCFPREKKISTTSEL